MKKLFYSFLVTGLVLVVSVNTSFAQQEKERTEPELDVVKTEKVQTNVKIALKKEKVQEKNKLKARPLRERAKIKAQPIERKVDDK